MKEVKTMVLSASTKEALEIAFKEIANSHVVIKYLDTTFNKSPYNMESFKIYMRTISYEREVPVKKGGIYGKKEKTIKKNEL